MPDRWPSPERFEEILGRYDLYGTVTDGGRLTFRFPEGAGFPVGVGMRLLSLLNQLAALDTGVVALEFDSPAGLYGYLDRNGFFRYLDPRIETTPARPSISGAERYEGNSHGLVEVAELSPGLAGEERQDAVSPLVESLDRVYRVDARRKHLRESVFCALTELIDNVYSHSETSLPGFAMLQAYPNKLLPSVQIAVSDSGIGIPASLRRDLGERVAKQADAQLIVKAFTKRGLSRLGSTSGRGCGLTTCARLAAEFGSTVHVRTESAAVRLSPARNGETQLVADARRVGIPLQGTHICLEFPLD
jgi:signal transduction histidine kinase